MKTELLPLNGKETKKLTKIAIETLKRLKYRPLPCQELNPGLLNRLIRGNLIDIVKLPSPYKTHKGRVIDHCRLNNFGFELLENINSHIVM